MKGDTTDYQVQNDARSEIEQMKPNLESLAVKGQAKEGSGKSRKTSKKKGQRPFLK